jgi:hypothetical protein
MLDEGEQEAVARRALNSDPVKVLWVDSRTPEAVLGFQATHSRIKLQTDKGTVNLFLKQTPHSSQKVILHYNGEHLLTLHKTNNSTISFHRNKRKGFW